MFGTLVQPGEKKSQAAEAEQSIHYLQNLVTILHRQAQQLRDLAEKCGN